MTSGGGRWDKMVNGMACDTVNAGGDDCAATASVFALVAPSSKMAAALCVVDGDGMGVQWEEGISSMTCADLAISSAAGVVAASTTNADSEEDKGDRKSISRDALGSSRAMAVESSACVATDTLWQTDIFEAMILVVAGNDDVVVVWTVDKGWVGGADESGKE